MAQSGAGIEDVVIVRGDGIRAPGQFQLHLKGADFLLFGGGENGVGIKVGKAFAQAVKKTRFFHFGGVIPGVRTKIFMTKDAVIGAHFFLGANVRGAKRAAGVQGAENGNRHPLLQGLGSQKHDLPALGQTMQEGRVKAGRRLARAGGSFDEQVSAGVEGLADGVHHLLLTWPRAGVGKGHVGGGGGFLLLDFEFRPPHRQQFAQPRLQFPLQDVFGAGHRQRELVAIGKVHVNQRAGHRRVAHSPPQMAINSQLALMTIEDRTGAWQVGRFEFFHQPTAVVVLDAAVQAPGDQRRPIFHRPALLEMDLAPVAGLGGAPRRPPGEMDADPQ